MFYDAHREAKTRRSKEKNTLQKGPGGRQETLNYFAKTWGLKVYTNEEVKVLNFLLKRKKVEQDIINIKSQEKIIELPSLDGSLHPAIINWIEDFGDGYFRAGLSYTGGYPLDGGLTEWVLKLDPEIGFKPMFCSLYWKEDC